MLFAMLIRRVREVLWATFAVVGTGMVAGAFVVAPELLGGVYR